jgi:radical SAM superfamily enzyme YgiQ (UPF0313 family)
MKDSFKVTFVTPHVGRKDPLNVDQYVRTWQMSNLPVATLAGLTPNDVETAFFDERMEFINFDAPTDLAAITIETYNAKRAYEVAAQFRLRGVPVIMGGYHAMLRPVEVSRYADSILVGYAEGVWPRVIRDAAQGRLQRRYLRNPDLPMTFGMPDRRILGQRNYLELSLVETGRGCPQRCNFCTITAVTRANYYPRPIQEIVADISTILESGGSRNIFLVDDNIVGNVRYARDLFRELAPLKIRWFSQGTLSMTRDPELLKLMADSGCVGLLVGFESLQRQTLLAMGKMVNVPFVERIRESVIRLHQHGIGIYGTFIFGYDETLADFQHTAEAAVDMGLFMAAFNPLVPFPGTGIYGRLLKDGRLADPEWYLDPSYRFGQIPFQPQYMNADELKAACLEARRTFYSWPSIIRRAANWRGNLTNPVKAGAYLYVNWQLRSEIDEKNDLPLGNQPIRPEPMELSNAVQLLL